MKNLNSWQTLVLVIRMEGLAFVATERRTAGPSAALGMTKFW